MSTNTLSFQPPVHMRVPPAAVTAAVGELAPDSPTSVPLTITTNATAVWVVLSTLAQGRFSDNAFLVHPGQDPAPEIHFMPWGEFGPKEHELLKTSLRVEHLAENL